MLTTFLSLLFLAADVPATPPTSYDISVSGPVVNIETSCNDPCRIEQIEDLGHAGGGAKAVEPAEGDDEDADAEDDCLGDCLTGGKQEGLHQQRGLRIQFDPKRDLREGLELTITDGQAHFIFYTVVETEKGRATRRQHAEFRIDRKLIELEVHDHDVAVRTEN